MGLDSIKIKPEWKQSKDEIWLDKYECLQDDKDSVSKPSIKFLYPFLYPAIAVIFLLAVLPFCAFFYTKTIEVPKGVHMSLNLPDGSVVAINAESKVSYKPFWWMIERKVWLGGEAFFEVKKGEAFSVYSDKGYVSVLGTSFNIFSRDESYRVACLSGKVSVNTESNTVILKPYMQAELLNDSIKGDRFTNTNLPTGWIEGKFNFESTPLADVIKEIERQYNIKIVASQNIDYFYTGNFTKLKNPEDVLRIIEKPFGIELKIKK